MAWKGGKGGLLGVILAVALPAATVRAQQPAAAPPPPAAPPAAAPAPASAPPPYGGQPAPYGGPPPAYPPPPGYAPAPYGAPPAYGYGYGYGAPAYGAPTPMQLMAFESQKKSAPLALVLEFFIFPGIGSIYADHAQGALITWAGIGGGIVLVLVGVSKLEHTIYDSSGQTTMAGNDNEAGTFILIGAIAILAGRIYGLVDSWQSATAYNQGLAKRLGLPAMAATVAPLRTDRGLAWGPALQLRF